MGGYGPQRPSARAPAAGGALKTSAASSAGCGGADARWGAAGRPSAVGCNLAAAADSEEESEGAGGPQEGWPPRGSVGADEEGAAIIDPPIRTTTWTYRGYRGGIIRV